MFRIETDSMAITMHRGDTGAFIVSAARASGADWTENDRMIFSVSGPGGLKVKRYYRLDEDRTSVDLDPGKVLIEFHNDDTDKWEIGTYSTELRFVIDPVWDGTAPTDDMVNAITSDAHIIEGSGVRTVIQSSLTLNGIIGEV